MSISSKILALSLLFLVTLSTISLITARKPYSRNDLKSNNMNRLLKRFKVSLPDDHKLTAYEALETFNFPEGLLPIGALGYDLEEKTGNFKAYLNGSCNFSLQGSYQLKYKSTISGIISMNKLTNLSGVSVKVMFFWVNIIEIRRKGDNLEFSVGIMSADFPVDNFEECPQCGCGMDCSNFVKGQIGNYVSSI